MPTILRDLKRSIFASSHRPHTHQNPRRRSVRPECGEVRRALDLWRQGSDGGRDARDGVQHLWPNVSQHAITSVLTASQSRATSRASLHKDGRGSGGGKMGKRRGSPSLWQGRTSAFGTSRPVSFARALMRSKTASGVAWAGMDGVDADGRARRGAGWCRVARHRYVKDRDPIDWVLLAEQGEGGAVPAVDV